MPSPSKFARLLWYTLRVRRHTVFGRHISWVKAWQIAKDYAYFEDKILRDKRPPTG